MSSSFKRLIPALNRVLIKKVEPLNKSKGGIILQQAEKVNLGEVVETGPGQFGADGNVIPVVVKKGDTVLLPDYGGTKIDLADGEFWVYRDSDIVGKLEK